MLRFVSRSNCPAFRARTRRTYSGRPIPTLLRKTRQKWHFVTPSRRRACRDSAAKRHTLIRSSLWHELPESSSSPSARLLTLQICQQGRVRRCFFFYIRVLQAGGNSHSAQAHETSTGPLGERVIPAGGGYVKRNIPHFIMPESETHTEECKKRVSRGGGRRMRRRGQPWSAGSWRCW